MDPILTLVKDELSRFVENLSPFAYSLEVIENNVVLSNAEFCGLLEAKQVSVNRSFQLFPRCKNEFYQFNLDDRLSIYLISHCYSQDSSST